MSSFGETLIAEIERSPMLTGLNELANRLVGLGVILIVKRKGVPFEFHPAGASPAVPEFCRLIVGDGQGQRRCMMCHALVALSPLQGNVTECTCHSGVCMIVSPMPYGRGEGIDEILLTTAAFRRGPAQPSWQTVHKCIRGLGLDRQALRAAYDALPVLDEEKLALALSLMDCASKAMAEVGKRVLLERQNAELRAAPGKSSQATTVEDEVRSALILVDNGPRTRPPADSVSPLVRVAAEVVTRHPSLPFTVAAIARAERISPNYFSNLFHRHMGQSFKHFLDSARLSRAETLLRNLSLSVQEVATEAGFEDTGYFIRWFKRKRQVTPRAWRHGR